MKVIEVRPESPSDSFGVRPGDILESISGRPVADEIDYRFLQAEHNVVLKLRRNGRGLEIEITKEIDEDLGLVLEGDRYRSCRNRCIFCFVHQLPPRLRRALYFKDEDYRLSFLFGNYITLTNLAEQDLERIEWLRLSPLYVSVHATDDELRRHLLGNPKAPALLPLMQRLARSGIAMHCQVVVCPGLNDGVHLDKTVSDLATLYPHVKTVALVPVGLTRFRKRLPRIRGFGGAEAQALLEQSERLRSEMVLRLSDPLVYAADDLFVKAGLPVPGAEYYGEFEQIENGVGMLRDFLDTFERRSKDIPRPGEVRGRLVLVTGASCAAMLNGLSEILRTAGWKARVVSVANHFFGETVTTSGLLTGTDIAAGLGEAALDRDDVVLLPPNCVNHDGVMLDDMMPERLSDNLGVRVVVGSYDLVGTLEEIVAGCS